MNIKEARGKGPDFALLERRERELVRAFDGYQKSRYYGAFRPQVTGGMFRAGEASGGRLVPGAGDRSRKGSR